MADERKFETVRDPLTEEEIRKYGESLAAVEKELQAAKEERKATVAEIAGRMNACQKRIAELTDLITSGFRSIEVEVIEIREPGATVKRIIRLDTNKEIRTEPLSWLERQEPLDFNKEPPSGE